MDQAFRHQGHRRERIAGMVVFLAMALAFGWIGYRLVRALHATETSTSQEIGPVPGNPGNE